jgi:hypothetical protein
VSGHAPKPETPAVRPGYSLPLPEEIPPPTPWPAGLALGVALFGWGLIASPVLLVIGALLFAVALGGWIGDLRA